MHHPGVAAKQGDLAKLVGDGRAGRGEPFVAQRHFQNRVVALGNAVENRRIVAQQFTYRHAMNSGNLVRARPQLDVEYQAPRNPLDAELAEILQEVLGYECIGVDDNFFQLGGDSLAAIQISTRLRDRLGVDLPVNELFDEPTLAALAAKVERMRESAAWELEEIERRLAMVESLSDEDVARMLAELAAEP